jgi:hypothetical protein
MNIKETGLVGGMLPKIIEPFDNVMRHLLKGEFPNGYVQGHLKIKIKKHDLVIQILSFDDDAVLKEWKKRYSVDDTIDFIGLKVAYELSFRLECP